MISSTLATAAILPVIALGTPLRGYPRAGGPAAVPIPGSCTLNAITPNGAVLSVPGNESYVFANNDTAPSDGFGPTTEFRGAQTTYSYFLEDDSIQPGWNESARIQMCLEQCYGFGGPCEGIAWGHNVWGDVYGYQVDELACLFFGTPVQEGDLASVNNGSWTQALVVNIDC